MVKHGSALELGLTLIQTKLGEAMGDPGFRAFTAEDEEKSTSAPAKSELPRTQKQTRDRTAKIRPPRILSVPA